MKVKNEKYKCYFCGSQKIKVTPVGIFLSLGGDEYCFCEKCLNGMTADDFWKHIFNDLGYAYPPKLTEWAQKAWDDGITLDEARYPSESVPKVSAITRKRIKKRGSMSNALRYEIMRRDNFQCVLCGATGRDDVLQVDHIKPASKGGDENKDNLRTTCRKCNSGKSDKVE